MDQELFIIEVLSAKQKIIEKAKKRAKRIMFKLLSLVFFSGLLFFGAVSFLYRHMSAVVRSAEGMQKLNNLYHFSWGVGGITIGCAYCFSSTYLAPLPSIVASFRSMA